MDSTKFGAIRSGDRLTLENGVQYRVDSICPKTGRVLRVSLTQGQGTRTGYVYRDTHVAEYVIESGRLDPRFTSIMIWDSIQGVTPYVPRYNPAADVEAADKLLHMAQRVAESTEESDTESIEA